MLLRRITPGATTKVNQLQKIWFSSSANDNENFGKIKSWQVNSYGGLDELQLANSRTPIIRSPTDIMVQVFASSVNPIDVAMMNGYGAVVLNFMRQAKACSMDSILEFPLILGRDFSGVIIQKGHKVDKNFSVGDEVWGVVPLCEQGAHAQKVIVPQDCVKKKPEKLSMTEAASMPYAAVTAWSALKITGGLSIVPVTGKRVLVLGGSGGVGTMAVQMLSSWGANVVTTCSTDAVPLLEKLGVFDVIDYTEPNFMEKIKKNKYDIILDCAGLGQDNISEYTQCLKEYEFSKYITLKSPLVQNFDQYGMFAGMIKNVTDLTFANLSSGVIPKLSTVLWGFFIPFETALKEITDEVCKGRIIPVVQKVYPFSELPEAYEHVLNGHLRGKIVVDMAGKSS